MIDKGIDYMYCASHNNCILQASTFHFADASVSLR